MFATLVGTNTPSIQYRKIFERLCEIAVTRGYILGDTDLRVQRDQISLEGWSLALRGPATGNADFFLAVTAPEVPGMSPIPVQQSVSGPLFAVMVLDTCSVVRHDGMCDIEEAGYPLDASDYYL